MSIKKNAEVKEAEAAKKEEADKLAQDLAAEAAKKEEADKLAQDLADAEEAEAAKADESKGPKVGDSVTVTNHTLYTKVDPTSGGKTKFSPEVPTPCVMTNWIQSQINAKIFSLGN